MTSPFSVFRRLWIAARLWHFETMLVRRLHTRSKAFAALTAFAVLTLVASAPSTPAYALHPMALWLVVHDLCARDMKLTGRPAPCTWVDPARGVAVVKDLSDPTQLLLVPTARISGIESPDLLKAGAPNYWQDAWLARTFLDSRAHMKVPREDVALAVNSISGRSQNQLHIHIDCVRTDVRDALAASQKDIGDRWSEITLLKSRTYLVRRVVGAELGENDPFRMLASSSADTAAAMGGETLVTVGAVLPDGELGFYVLARRANTAHGDMGHGEELLDHQCEILHQAAELSASPATR